jgi:hypothetical protein
MDPVRLAVRSRPGTRPGTDSHITLG